eukprot:1138415-Pelagomonas_calceolata.AAC.6
MVRCSVGRALQRREIGRGAQHNRATTYAAGQLQGIGTQSLQPCVCKGKALECTAFDAAEAISSAKTYHNNEFPIPCKKVALMGTHEPYKEPHPISHGPEVLVKNTPAVGAWCPAGQLPGCRLAAADAAAAAAAAHACPWALAPTTGG